MEEKIKELLENMEIGESLKIYVDTEEPKKLKKDLWKWYDKTEKNKYKMCGFFIISEKELIEHIIDDLKFNSNEKIEFELCKKITF